MKKILFNILFIMSLCTSARQLPFTKENISIKKPLKNYLRTSEGKVLVDSAWNIDWNAGRQKYDSLFSIIDAWNEKTGEPLGGLVYKIQEGLRFNNMKAEVSQTSSGIFKIYTQTLSNWDSLSQSWLYDQRNVIMQNSQNGSDTNITYVWKKDAWIPTIKRAEYFDRINDSTNITQYVWSIKINQWQKDDHSIYKLNSEGHELLGCSYNWDTLSTSWQGKYRYEFTYTNRGQQSTRFDYQWNKTSNDWNVTQKTLTYFDTKQESSTDSIYTLENNIWKTAIGQKREYLYDGDQRITRLKAYDFDRNGGTELGYTENYSYDILGRVLAVREDTYNKYENLNDKNGHNLLHADYNWDAIKKEWVGERKYETEYDEFGNELIYKRSEWNSKIGDWYITDLEKNFYSWHEIVSVQDHVHNNTSFIYPNPSKDFVKIVSEESMHYKLYSIQSDLVLQGYGHTLDLREIPEGIYLLQLQIKDMYVIQKLIKN